MCVVGYKYLVVVLLVSNVPMMIYFSLIHQRGSLTIMDELRTVGWLIIIYSQAIINSILLTRLLTITLDPNHQCCSLLTAMQHHTTGNYSY